MDPIQDLALYLDFSRESYLHLENSSLSLNLIIMTSMNTPGQFAQYFLDLYLFDILL